MTATERVYAEFVEPRSFGCKRCGYTSTNRWVVEQHLRTDHPELFEENPSPLPPSPPRQAGVERGVTGTVHGEGNLPTDKRPGDGTAGLGTAQSPSAVSPSPPVKPGGRGQGGGVPTSPVIFYTDAGTWENGTARQRSVLAVWDSRPRAIVLDEELPGTTNNEAEYAAIIAALERARADGLTGILIRSDSQLCVNQIQGTWQVKEARLRPLRDRAARLLTAVQGRIAWVPRGRNQAGIYLETKYKR